MDIQYLKLASHSNSLEVYGTMGFTKKKQLTMTMTGPPYIKLNMQII